MPEVNAGAQAIEELIIWANDVTRRIWWRHCVRLLLEKQKLIDRDYELLLQLARSEAGFNMPVALTEYCHPVSSVGFSYEEKAVKLLKISSVDNVSALASGQNLDFDPECLTAIYGDNGAGKSSYAKILKNACLTRGEKPAIQGNVFTQNKATPSAQLPSEVEEDVGKLEAYFIDLKRRRNKQ